MDEKAEILLPVAHNKRQGRRRSLLRLAGVAAVLVFLLVAVAARLQPLSYFSTLGLLDSDTISRDGRHLSCSKNRLPSSLTAPPNVTAFHDCSIETYLGTGLPFLETAIPIQLEEFVERRDRLARALVADGVEAFVAEPGYTFQYYANVSQPDWEVWEPEERPFLMIIQPTKSGDSGTIIANTTFLVPSFEAIRARLLRMPFQDELRLIPWEEHWDPYDTLLWSGIFDTGSPKVMVDEEMRDFIQRGLGMAGFNVVGLGGEVEKVKQTKSAGEVAILKAVNTGTVEALKAMRRCLVPGLTENDVQEALDDTMRAAGMEPFFDIVEFGYNAALPHGGHNGSKTLEFDEFILIDVGAHLYGYSSDVCRTFFPPFVPKPRDAHGMSALAPRMKEMIQVWNVVLEAQSKSIKAMKSNATCASIDIAARDVIEGAGLGSTFTHRVGHGVGIKAHESPYLNKGNLGTKLGAGMAFTSEPGVYITGKFGVRHEDVLLVRESGEPDVLSGVPASTPWDP